MDVIVNKPGGSSMEFFVFQPMSVGPPNKKLTDASALDRFAYVSSVQAMRQNGGTAAVPLAAVAGAPVALPVAGNLKTWDSSVRISLAASEFTSFLCFYPAAASSARVSLFNQDGGECDALVSTAPSDDLLRTDQQRGLPAVKRLAVFRKDRLAEIVAQMTDIEQMLIESLGLDLSKVPFTFELMLVGTSIASIVVQRVKHELNRLRPSQLDPSVAPVIPVPGHASFPSGHAIQAQVAVVLLAAAWLLGGKKGQPPQGFFSLPDLIALNRVIAGLHYPVDSDEGLRLGLQLVSWILACANSNPKVTDLDGTGTLAAAGLAPIMLPPKISLPASPLLAALFALAVEEFK